MKNLFVMLTFFFFGVITYGQSLTPPTINISQNPIETVNCGSTTCFRADPGVEHTYSVTPTSDGSYTTNSGWTRSNPTWEATANTFTPPQFGQGPDPTMYKAIWNNAPNSPARTIKVTYTYTKVGETSQSFSKEVVVIVKHIGPITAMTIAAASPSNPTNGSTVSVPCGANSFTISVSPPATDPASAINYTWSLPANWTGSSTTNSITVTPNAGVGGAITVSAKRADGNVVRSYSVNVTRPTVESALINSIALERTVPSINRQVSFSMSSTHSMTEGGDSYSCPITNGWSE